MNVTFIVDAYSYALKSAQKSSCASPFLHLLSMALAVDWVTGVLIPASFASSSAKRLSLSMFSKEKCVSYRLLPCREASSLREQIHRR